MEYLVSKNNLKRKAHICIGGDATCRTLTGEQKRELQFEKFESSLGRDVCQTCMSRLKSPGKWGIKAKPIAKKKKAKKKPSPGFYMSEEWRKVRYEVIKKAGGCCSACGRNYKEDRVKIHVDHIKPRSRFPQLELDPDNLQILCEDCNLGKSNVDFTDWR